MVIFVLILIVVYIIGMVLTAMLIQDLFYIDERKTSTTKWILSMVLVLLSFIGLLLSFLFCVFIVLFDDVVIDNYKKWAIYKIFFRK